MLTPIYSVWQNSLRVTVARNIKYKIQNTKNNKRIQGDSMWLLLLFTVKFVIWWHINIFMIIIGRVAIVIVIIIIDVIDWLQQSIVYNLICVIFIMNRIIAIAT